MEKRLELKEAEFLKQIQAEFHYQHIEIRFMGGILPDVSSPFIGQPG